MKPPEFREYSVGELLYETTCHTCGYKLEWFADFDADGTSYNAQCCDKRYYVTTSKLKLIEIETEIKEDE